MDWKKFLTTEWICFVIFTGVAVTALFKQPVEVSFVEVAGFLVAVAVNLGVVRTWQKGQQVKLQMLEKEK